MTNVTYNRWRGWLQRYPPSLSSCWFQGNANFFKNSFPYQACLWLLTNIEEKLFFKVSTFLAVFGFHFYSKTLSHSLLLSSPAHSKKLIQCSFPSSLEMSVSTFILFFCFRTNSIPMKFYKWKNSRVWFAFRYSERCWVTQFQCDRLGLVVFSVQLLMRRFYFG